MIPKSHRLIKSPVPATKTLDLAVGQSPRDSEAAQAIATALDCQMCLLPDSYSSDVENLKASSRTFKD